MDKIIAKKKWTLKKSLTIVFPALVVFFSLYVFLLADRSRKLNVEKDKLTISVVKKAPFQEFIPVSGTIEPFQTFFLDISDGGKVVKKFVEEGAFLEAGDPIIQIDNPNLSLQVMSTQSNFMMAESQARQNKLTFEQSLLSKENQLLELNMKLLSQKRIYETNKALYNKKLCSVTEYETSREQYEYLLKSKDLTIEVLKKDSITNVQMIQQSEANVQKQKNYLSLIESQLSNLTVKAPIKGQLTSLNAEIGQSIGSGYKLGQIDNTDSYKIRAEVDEHYISKVKTGLQGEYEYNNKTYMLTVKTVYPQITNGKFNIDLVFEGEKPEGIRRGQTVHVKLQLGNLSDALLVEAGSFFTVTGGQWIFVLDKSESYAVKKQIKIGRQNPQFYEIIEGLSDGEKVITSSYENYSDSDKLILK